MSSPNATVEYIKVLERLWDDVSDMVEGGRITEADIPDDYEALVFRMLQCGDAQTDYLSARRKVKEPQSV